MAKTKKRLFQWKQPHSKLPVRLPLTYKNYCVVVVSVGLGELVVSTGVVVVVSLPVVVVVSEPVVVVSLDIGGAEVSEPVDFSGVSQPIVAIAKKAMKRILFMRNYFKFNNVCLY